MKAYLGRISAWLSQGIHCILLGGHHDQTVSARAYMEYRLLGNRRWAKDYYFLNALFLFQEDHCLTSYLADIEFAKEVLNVR